MKAEIPPPLPNELLYSAIARGLLRTGANHLHLSQAVHHQATYTVHPLVPANLNLVSSNLRAIAGWNLSGAEILNRHTLFRAAAPFVNQGYPDAQCMCERSIYGSLRRRPLYTLMIRAGYRLRVCPACVTADREKHGEAYWHAEHQMGWLRCCPTHGTQLRDTDVQPALDRMYVAAEQSCLIETPPIPAAALELHSRLGRQLQTLMTDREHTFSLSSFANAYRDKMWLLGTRVGRSNHVHEDLIAHYGEESLRSLGFNVANGRLQSCWLYRDSTGNGPPAQFFALLADRCGEELLSLLAVSAPEHQPDEAPWPCMNPGCTHHQQRIIMNRSPSRRSRHFTFRCPVCLVSYKRDRAMTRRSDGTFEFTLTGRDTTHHDSQIRQLWMDPTLTLKAISEKLGLYSQTVRLYAGRLGLPAVGNRTVLQPTRAQDPAIAAHERNLKRREEWSALMAKQEKTISELRRLQALKRALRAYDPTWSATQPALATLDRRDPKLVQELHELGRLKRLGLPSPEAPGSSTPEFARSPNQIWCREA